MAVQLTLCLSGLRIPDEPEAWKRLGFVVSGDIFEVGGLTLRLDPTEDTPAWSFSLTGGGQAPSETELEVDGIPTRVDAIARPDPSARPGSPHPNGIVGVDHVVVTTPDGPRTAEALASFGLELRRRRPTSMGGVEMEQWFYRPGTIVEVVAPAEPAGEGPARVWGITFVSDDLDTTARRLGPLLSAPRPAVQQGRQIASVRRDAGLRTRVAVMDSHLPRGRPAPHQN